MDRERLYAQLEVPDVLPVSAPPAPSSRSMKTPGRGGLVAAILMNAEVRILISKRLGAALDLLYPPDGPFASGLCQLARVPMAAAGWL